MASEKLDSFELPGIDEFKAREGTSTHILAGAVKFWHDKYQSARADGFIAGVSLIAVAEILASGVYFYLRNR